MSDNVSHGLVVQFLVSGFGSDEDFQRRVAIEELVGNVLEANDNGESTGGDGGSGTMNAFFSVNDPVAARVQVLRALGDAGELDEGMVVVHQVSNDDGDDLAETIWWPADYAFSFSTFGPTWKGVPSKEELDGLSEGLLSLQGQWRVNRYDTPDGSDATEWASELCFLIARDQLMVRRQVAVISAARLRIDVPGEVDLRPIMGANRGGLAVGRYELRGEELHFCVVSPGEARPPGIAPTPEHQPGRMILRREG